MLQKLTWFHKSLQPGADVLAQLLGDDGAPISAVGSSSAVRQGQHHWHTELSGGPQAWVIDCAMIQEDDLQMPVVMRTT